LYFIFRQFILQGPTIINAPASFRQSILTAFKTVGYYFHLLFFPVRLSLEHPFFPPDTFSDPTVVFPAVALLVLLCFIAFYFQRSRLLSFGAGWVIITLLPAANLVYLARPISEQRLYLPSWGTCLLLAVVIISIQRLDNVFFMRGKRVVILAFGAIAAFYCVQTVSRNHDWQSPLVLYAKWARHAPYSPSAHAGLGDVLTMNGFFESARKQYNIARQLRPDYAEACYGLGMVSAEEGKSDDAVHYFESALQLDPDHAGAHRQMGGILARQRRFAEALTHYHHVLRLFPDDTDAHYNLGVSLAETGQIEAAIEHFQAVLCLNPGDVDASYNLGVAMVKKHRLSQAINWFERVLQLDPDHSKACLNLGAIYERQGRRLKALYYYNQAIVLDPEPAGVHQNMAAALKKEQQRAEQDSP
jgi:tetratricopeptide (TPR) repeat protein